MQVKWVSVMFSVFKVCSNSVIERKLSAIRLESAPRITVEWTRILFTAHYLSAIAFATTLTENWQKSLFGIPPSCWQPSSSQDKNCCVGMGHVWAAGICGRYTRGMFSGPNTWHTLIMIGNTPAVKKLSCPFPVAIITGDQRDLPLLVKDGNVGCQVAIGRGSWSCSLSAELGLGSVIAAWRNSRTQGMNTGSAAKDRINPWRSVQPQFRGFQNVPTPPKKSEEQVHTPRPVIYPVVPERGLFDFIQAEPTFKPLVWVRAPVGGQEAVWSARAYQSEGSGKKDAGRRGPARTDAALARTGAAVTRRYGYAFSTGFLVSEDREDVFTYVLLHKIERRGKSNKAIHYSSHMATPELVLAPDYPQNIHVSELISTGQGNSTKELSRALFNVEGVQIKGTECGYEPLLVRTVQIQS
ncbi:hypothetical protein C8F04DRAFT_1179637 [Mycena alexandri]|uniref:Uncharacterized protein n=1 Tax=Mycena alexandri TaxID=1745969 RepID=A0AAD6T376_9AGAR|nr:hypothetical protein C8F04DRAFT_1179637 [Mycena alexandri]